MRGAPTRRRLYLPTVAVVAATGVLAVVGWHQLGGAAGAARAVGQLRGEVTGPIVLGFLAVVLVAERLRPAVRRPFTSRGQMHDLVYLGLYALAVVPLIALIGAGFFGVMQRVAPWLVLPRLAFLPTWAFVVLEVVVLDAANWLAHLALHRFGALWRLHAVHHSQEELSILTSFRTHPLVHTAYLLTALPAFSSSATGPCRSSQSRSTRAWGRSRTPTSDGRTGRLARYSSARPTTACITRSKGGLTSISASCSRCGTASPGGRCSPLLTWWSLPPGSVAGRSPSSRARVDISGRSGDS
jgi:hypothetical protein